MELSTSDKIMHLDSIREMSANIYDAVDHIKRIEKTITQTSNKKWKLNEDGRHIKKIKNKLKSVENEFETPILHEIIDTPRLKREIYFAKKIINKIVENLFSLSENNNYYWRNCSLETYKKHLDNFQNLFFELIPEAEYQDFLEHELTYLLDKTHKPNFNHKTELPDYFTIDLTEYLFDKNIVKTDFVKKRKINFIITEIENLGFKVDVENNYRISKNENSNSSIDNIPQEEPLNLKDLPDFDTLDRFQLIKKLGVDDIIHNLDTSQKSKYKILALIMKIHPDNARKLMSNKYPKLKSKEEIKTLNQEASENVNTFFNNPTNNIKIP